MIRRRPRAAPRNAYFPAANRGANSCGKWGLALPASRSPACSARTDSLGGTRGADESAAPASRLAPKQPHFATPAKNVIFLMMNGGPSHIDTFDYKPELAKYAGKTLPEGKTFTNSGNRKMGFLTPAWRPFRPGGQSGLMISDYFPRVCEHADKLALLLVPYG